MRVRKILRDEVAQSATLPCGRPRESVDGLCAGVILAREVAPVMRSPEGEASLRGGIGKSDLCVEPLVLGGLCKTTARYAGAGDIEFIDEAMAAKILEASLKIRDELRDRGLQ
jgi:hypothetical protein